jgi:hypothetical protein
MNNLTGRNACRENLVIAILLSLVVLVGRTHGGESAEAPFEYMEGKAYHVLPRTHNNESGYFSLCEGADGRIYVGTAKYRVNSYLVEFDPQTGNQRVVADTHAICGLDATGYAAQAKIHTRNDVGRSGTIYFGSMQGHIEKGDDPEDYPGGYVMTYDPQADRAECLGMPHPGEGVIDVVADEQRGIVYVVGWGEGLWQIMDMESGKSRTIAKSVIAFGTTLLDARGWASALTTDWQLLQHDPETGQTTRHPILIDGERWEPEGGGSVPAWRIDPDGKTAWLIQMKNPTLIEIDLSSEGEAAEAVSHGPMIEGRAYDSRSALDIGPDGRVYAVVRVKNETGFGGGHLHHLVRYDPEADRMEDLGVLTVQNPDFVDWGPEGPKPNHGYHRLPDGTLTPLWHHLAMIITREGEIYTTILYPFTLLRISSENVPGMAEAVD